MARTSGGINKKARIAILEHIQQKLAKKEELYKVSDSYYTQVNLSDLAEMTHLRKPQVRRILNNMINEHLVYEVDLETKNKYSRYKNHGYRLRNDIYKANIGELKHEVLYSTRKSFALKALKIYNQETRQPAKSYNRRTFCRIGTIMKEIFHWDWRKFKAWCRWIYQRATKGTRTLLDSNKAVAIFVRKRFQNIYNKYAPSFEDDYCVYKARARDYEWYNDTEKNNLQYTLKMDKISSIQRMNDKCMKLPNVIEQEGNARELSDEVLNKILKVYGSGYGSHIVYEEYKTEVPTNIRKRYLTTYSLADLREEQCRRQAAPVVIY